LNLSEGTRRLALLLGVVGAILGCFASYVELQTILNQKTRHNKFVQVAASDVVQQERKSQAGWVSIDPKTGERADWYQLIDKGGINSIHWTKDNEVESIVTQDGQTFYQTPAPSAWLYLLVVLFPILGFFIPWGAIRAIGWVGAGFFQPSK
jgi:predicted small secreted protein